MMENDRVEFITLILGIVLTGIITDAALKLGIPESKDVGFLILGGLFALARVSNKSQKAAADDAGASPVVITQGIAQ